MLPQLKTVALVLNLALATTSEFDVPCRPFSGHWPLYGASPWQLASATRPPAVSPVAAFGTPYRPQSPYAWSTPIPNATAPPGTTANKNTLLTVNVVNSMAIPLAIDFTDGVGKPHALGSPTAGTLVSSTQLLYPTRWSGRISLGRVNDVNNSKIEGSFENNTRDMDISYVDGYSVPIICMCTEQRMFGCEVDLFETGQPCPLPNGPTCYNDMRFTPNGPASNFFRACEGLAFTYANDNAANAGNCSSSVDCCVGARCWLDD